MIGEDYNGDMIYSVLCAIKIVFNALIFFFLRYGLIILPWSG